MGSFRRERNYSALEAMLLGRNAISTDANPLASLITRAKCTALSPEQRAELSSLVERIKTIVNAGDLESLLATMAVRAGNVPLIPISQNGLRLVQSLSFHTSAQR